MVQSPPSSSSPGRGCRCKFHVTPLSSRTHTFREPLIRAPQILWAASLARGSGPFLCCPPCAATDKPHAQFSGRAMRRNRGMRDNSKPRAQPLDGYAAIALVAQDGAPMAAATRAFCQPYAARRDTQEPPNFTRNLQLPATRRTV
ncbi:hypothetical protein XFF6991_420046 [Xanthomonas phaseoli pv. phaseoli]|uniref:Uncharacterized protein n=1 Tax=Xanthomonas campestris pv. phaseoli TaxID=317013 RepID=A0A7Z7NIN0_XANCH|nr:hypothetical protein XFF6991_420046 [Xanthomonas phaseoli pv. phaseoli]